MLQPDLELNQVQPIQYLMPVENPDIILHIWLDSFLQCFTLSNIASLRDWQVHCQLFTGIAPGQNGLPNAESGMRAWLRRLPVTGRKCDDPRSLVAQLYMYSRWYLSACQHWNQLKFLIHGRCQLFLKIRCQLLTSMAALSYPLVRPYHWPTIVPRKTIPVYPPPEPLVYPSLPSKPRQLPVTSKFTLSTHIVPAAHLRTLPYAPTPLPLPPNSSKAERKAQNERFHSQLDILAAPPVSSGHPILLWLCLNRFVRKGAKGMGLTLFFAHANGFPKEVRRKFYCSHRHHS